MNNEFTKQGEEIKRVAEEINLLRRDIQTASAALGRIERRLKAAFPNYPTKLKQLHKKKNIAKPFSSKKAEELKTIFNDLVFQTQNGGDSAFATKIGEFSDADVIALATEVGISSRNRSSRSKATDGVRKRVQEAMQLQFEKK